MDLRGLEGIKFESDILDMYRDTVNIRRDIHRHPEGGFEERRTARIAAQALEEMGLEVRTGIAKTGVLGLLRGSKPGPTLLIRSDMDALPLQEENAHEYCSTVEGFMHACGHDAHVAMLICLARYLKKRWKEIDRGVVKFAFQPAEEGFGGAEPMIAEGILEKPDVDAAFGFHVWNMLPIGKIGFCAGPIMAAADKFFITITGKGGHGALPHDANDSIVAAANVISALQTIISRNLNPLDSGVITIGTVRGGSGFNIISETVEMSGTARSLTPETRDYIRNRMEEVIAGVTTAYNADYKFDYIYQYPPLVNDKGITEFIRASAEEIAPGRTVSIEPTMGGEDFAYFARKVPASFFVLGSANADRGLDEPHHSPRFDIDERALAVGVQVLANAARKFLFEHKPRTND